VWPEGADDALLWLAYDLFEKVEFLRDQTLLVVGEEDDAIDVVELVGTG
jgi:hypothetical protein